MPHISKKLAIFRITLPLLLLTTISNAQTSRLSPTLNIKLDNDYFSLKMRGNDRYYSNGVLIGASFPADRKNLLDRMCIPTSSEGVAVRSISVEHQIHTPHHIGNPDLQVGDYPYAALLVLNYENRAMESTYSFTSKITLGVQGPAAMGKDIQTALHKRVFHSNIPQGWDYQLPNDLALCYSFTFDKLLYKESSVEFLGTTTLKAGTLYNNLTVGSRIRVGKISSYFNAETWLNGGTQSQLYFFAEPYVTLVKGNSLLEGGPFKSPGGAWGTSKARYYHIHRDLLERIVYGYSWGICYVSNHFRLALTEHLRSPEIKGVPSHEYASISLGFKL